MTLYFASLFCCSLSLRISKNHFRRWVTHFRLRADLLNLHALLPHSDCKRCNLLLELLHSLVLFEEFVEQHCVHRLVAHGVDFPLFITNHQIRIDRFHVLGHQTKLWNPLRVYSVLVTEGDRFERQEHFAGPLHWLNLFFEPSRRGKCTKFAV